MIDIDFEKINEHLTKNLIVPMKEKNELAGTILEVSKRMTMEALKVYHQELTIQLEEAAKSTNPE